MQIISKTAHATKNVMESLSNPILEAKSSKAVLTKFLAITVHKIIFKLLRNFLTCCSVFWRRRLKNLVFGVCCWSTLELWSSLSQVSSLSSEPTHLPKCAKDALLPEMVSPKKSESLLHRVRLLHKRTMREAFKLLLYPNPAKYE